MLAEVFLFVLGFSSITTVYEIAKTSKRGKSDKIKRNAERIAKMKG